MSMPLDPIPTPPSVTPQDTPSSPSDYAGVTPHGRGPAPYDIQAPIADLTAESNSAVNLSGAGVLYPKSDRQAAAETLITSPPGFGTDGFDDQNGYSGGGGGSWPVDVEPPDQAGFVYPGVYQGTTQGDVPKYGG